MLLLLKNPLYVDAVRIKPIKSEVIVHRLPERINTQTRLGSTRPWQESSCLPPGSSCTCDMCIRLNRMQSQPEGPVETD